MNYLDLLPNDVLKIVNRKVEDLRTTSRRKERKENKKINREQKRIADYKRSIYKKYVSLYMKHIIKKQSEYCTMMNEVLKKELVDYYVKTEVILDLTGKDEPYILVYFKKNIDLFRIKVYDLETYNDAEIEHMANFYEPSGYKITYN